MPPRSKAVVPKGADGKYHCPECSQVFEFPTGLGIHRKMAHKVAGSSSASLAYRRAKKRDLKAAKTASALTKLPPVSKLKGKNIKALKPTPAVQPSMFAESDPDSIGSVLEASVEASKPTSIEAEFPCLVPECSRVFAGVRWRSKHMNAAHPEYMGAKSKPQTLVVAKGHTNGNSISKNEHESPIDNAGETLTRFVPNELVTLVIGQFKALCQGVAYENDIPSRDFTRRCAKYFHAIEGR